MPRGRFEDLTGRRFGKLLVVGRAGKWWRKSGTYWVCRCDCDPSVLTRPIAAGNLGVSANACGCGKSSQIQKMAALHRREWSPEEDALLGTMSDREAAGRLGIDDTTVGDRRRLLGVAPSSRMGAGPRRRWPAEDVAALAGMTDAEAAARFGVSEKAIRAKRCREAQNPED